MKISGRAKLAGVIGNPVAHSLSPQLHRHWLDAYGIDGAYVPLPVACESFAFVISALRKAGVAGVNITVPHKEAAFAMAERHDRAALACGAVNLLVFHPNGLEGRNTDVAGLAASLAENLGADWLKGGIAVILGAGGAARAAVLALDGLGVAKIRLIARNSSRAEMLARELKPSVRCATEVAAWSEWPGAAGDTGLLVNATSAGMTGKPALGISLEGLSRDAAVSDLVYNPLETALLSEARAHGHRVIDGLGMLMHQAVPAFEAFFGVRPEVTPALRKELEDTLRGGR